MKRSVDQYADLYPSGFDYLLTAISGVLACHSVGMAVSNPIASRTFVILSLLGIWISYGVMRSWRSARLANTNGFFYAGGVVAAFIVAKPLCDMIPDNPFKGTLFVAGALCWMLIIGSFFIWSDQTLLFQAVPSLALFGLVGCYGTYQDGTWTFFGFLLCFATSLARNHSRTMLRQARDSGYSQSGDRMDRSATELQRMKSGPWKWVAGPQWALGSAFAVILFSFVGAPIVRQSVQGIAANVPVPMPAAANRNTTASGAESVSIRIGDGPVAIDPLPVFRINLDRPRYLRTATYQVYSRSGWNALGNQPIGDQADAIFGRSMDRRSISTIKNRETIEFAVEPVGKRMLTLPAPGEVIQVDPPTGVVVHYDGTMGLDTTANSNIFRGKALVAVEPNSPTESVREIPAGMEAVYSTQGVSPVVFDLANRAAEAGKTDYQKALLIEQEIAKRAKYNIDAAATPANVDPVEHFLFTSHEGYCTIFASSMVVMSRSVGIPARLVVGYYPFNNERDDSGRYLIKNSDRHAWAELFFKDYGWVPFDATELADVVGDNGRGSSNQTDITKEPWVRTLIDVLIGIGALGILLLSLRTVIQSMKAIPTRSDLDKTYIRFADVLARASGKSRNYDQTPAEYLASATAYLNGEGALARSINDRFELLMYSPLAPTKEALASLRNDIAKLKSQLSKSRQKVA